jgi:hypothetical protein
VRRVLLLACLVLAAVLVGSAVADTTIGQAGGGFDGCTNPSSFVLGDVSYVVPSGGGTITSFSFQSVPSNTNQKLDFLVLRPAGSGNYTVVGQTGQVTLAGTGAETFTANISVQGGDILGFWEPGNLDNCERHNNTNTGGRVASLNGAADPNVGATVQFGTPNPLLDLNESATLVTQNDNSQRQNNNQGQNNNHH